MVVDSSIALAWCFADKRTPFVVSVQGKVVVAGADVPGLWWLELVNGLLVNERRGRLTLEIRHRLVEQFRRLPIRVDEDTWRRARDDTMKLAERFRLTAYDAAYIELALRRELPLVTLDDAMLAAAASLGLDVLTEG
jgi:predicted nucleic acid-binding protein